MKELQKLAEFVESIDPLSGPNVMKYADRNFIDNGDGTMTIRRRNPYQSLEDENDVKRNSSNAGTLR